MSWKIQKAEEIIGILRDIEILNAIGKSVEAKQGDKKGGLLQLEKGIRWTASGSG
ncbi:MAG: hypothetical protein LBR98_09435 [Syntrophomonadaceae bacterium]|nr:hypothetical protein [Syntrophomonadaceae bacterium]